MTETRATIATAIERHPGVHFNGLVRHLDMAPGQVQYHLRRLHSDDSVVVEKLYGRTHYYPPGYDSWERRACGLLRRETAGDIVAYLLANGPTAPADIAADLDLARSTVSWHLDRLEEQDVVGKRGADPNATHVVLERPTETVQLLRAVDPSLREKLVGRFTRLVDQLLE